MTVQEIVDDIIWNLEGHAIAVWAPIVRARKGTHADLFKQMVEQGHLFGKSMDTSLNLRLPQL